MATNGQPAAAAATIDDLPENLLLDIFLRLPSLSDLVRAACTCLPWRNLVTNFPPFRRQFIDLHPAPLLSLFFGTPFPNVPHNDFQCIPAFAPARRNDPELMAAILSGDFFLTTLQVHDGPEAYWIVYDAHGGYLLLKKLGELLLALLNPLARWCERFFDLRDAHLFLVAHGKFRLRAVVFSSFLGIGGDWFLSPWLDVPHADPEGGQDDLLPESGMRVGNFIYWPYRKRFNIGFMLRQEDGLDAGAWVTIRVFNLTDEI
ncbi:hypothetical protein TRIUR3_34355 [Triticum urartu]|uniref:Uncharacterized protein n=1 Tax=Triticum urartu TaxID=4572 RepID=M7ZXY9_TRIUA|nr:hypothetical protein TRIUR3_34355 [Triticum urartu]